MVISGKPALTVGVMLSRSRTFLSLLNFEFDLEHYEPEPKPEHLYYVLCVDCKEETQGYVTSGYIGYVRGKDYEDYGRSILSLATVIDLPVSQTGIRKEGHSEKENIEALGF